MFEIHEVLISFWKFVEEKDLKGKKYVCEYFFIELHVHVTHTQSRET